MTLNAVDVAPAKLNLALHVRRRRLDGYHELETVFAFVSDGDVLTVSEADRDSFAVTGPFAAALQGGGNLVLDARDGFAARFGPLPPLGITLDKRLPVASGIGGGSADAAAMLRILARSRDIACDDEALLALALKIGSDVPACLLGRTMLGRGRGERLDVLPGGSGTPVLLVNPLVALSTRAVFAGWDGQDRGALPDGDALAIAREGRNDLQPSARALVPVIGEVLDRLTPGATVARMSGSGATCFALYADGAARDAAAARIAAERPKWWRLASVLR